MNGFLIHKLKLHKIIDADGTVNAKHKQKLFAYPDLLQEVIRATQFLRYDASILVRIHCVLLDVTEQPTCNTCKQITKMRTSGRKRFTFPEFCSGACASKNTTVLRKREGTNILKYGVRYPIHKH